MLQLLSGEDAKKRLEDPDAKEEMERLNMSKYSSFDDDIKVEDVKAFSDSLEGADNVNLTVKEIMNRDISSSEQYHILRADEDILNPDDYKYITLNGNGKVKEWAETKLGA
jgi:hypothetical protein